MCGIIGLIRQRNNRETEHALAALSAMHHRGPDSSHIKISANRRCLLGHTRLSINDIPGGHQPLVSADGLLIAVVNGEFYDYRTIRASLEQEGFSFSTESDSEILLALYQKHGVACLEYLNGEFAFALWDEARQQLFMARDRFGTKPLFYSLEENGLRLGSTVQSLVSLGIDREINETYLAACLAGLGDAGGSYVQGVKQLLPGHYALFNAEGFKEVLYWEMQIHDRPSTLSGTGAVVQFSELFEQAVVRRLQADVPVGCYLSGGIDSSAVLAMAAKHQPDIHAYTIEFDEEAINEIYYAQQVTEHLGVTLSTLRVTADDIADHYEAAVKHREAPIIQTNGVAKYLLSRHVQERGGKVVLTGEGADEILGGYASFVEDYIQAQPGHQHSALFTSTGITPSPLLTEGLFAVEEVYGYVPSFIKSLSYVDEVMQGVLLPDFNKASLASLVLATLPSRSGASHPVHHSMRLWSKTLFPELILTFLGDRMEMAHSIEGRLPFLDKDLVAFVNQLPINFKINEQVVEKSILREAMQPLLPENIVKRRKMIFAAPAATQLGAVLPRCQQLMMDVFSSQSFKDLNIFCSSSLHKQLQQLPTLDQSTKVATEFAMNLVLSTYFLIK